jgi:hypothetical protein
MGHGVAAMARNARKAEHDLAAGMPIRKGPGARALTAHFSGARQAGALAEIQPVEHAACLATLAKVCRTRLG